MHYFIYVVPPNYSITRKKKNDSLLQSIMNVMFGYCRMLLSEAPYWGSSTWVRTKGAKVVWWSTSPRSWAWFPVKVLLFMLPRSMQLSALLALSGYVLRVAMWIFCTGLQRLFVCCGFLLFDFRRLNIICLSFGILFCVPKYRHIKFRHKRITQMEEHNIHKWRNFEIKELFVGAFRSFKILKRHCYL